MCVFPRVCLYDIDEALCECSVLIYHEGGPTHLHDEGPCEAEQGDDEGAARGLHTPRHVT